MPYGLPDQFPDGTICPRPGQISKLPDLAPSLAATTNRADSVRPVRPIESGNTKRYRQTIALRAPCPPSRMNRQPNITVRNWSNGHNIPDRFQTRSAGRFRPASELPAELIQGPRLRPTRMLELSWTLPHYPQLPEPPNARKQLRPMARVSTATKTISHPPLQLPLAACAVVMHVHSTWPACPMRRYGGRMDWFAGTDARVSPFVMFKAASTAQTTHWRAPPSGIPLASHVVQRGIVAR